MAKFFVENKGKMVLGAVCLFIIVSLGGAAAVMQRFEQMRDSLTVQYEREIEANQARSDKKIADLKADILNRLKKCESSNLDASDAPIILDSNNEISIGLFMFQRDTVIYYVKQLEKRDITRQEAVRIAIDDVKARELAGRILFETKDGWRNWYNCGKKLGLATEIEVIKKVQ